MKTRPPRALRSQPPEGAPGPRGRPGGSRSAIVLFAHGSRDTRWAEPFEAVAARIRSAEPDRKVALAYLELMRPDLREAVDRLVAEGADRIDVVPLFLGTGGHLRDDLPPLVAAARTAHGGVVITLHPAIGENAAVIDAMAQAALVLTTFGE